MYCECGCGQVTSIAKESRPQRGIIKGQHVKFISGHNNRNKAVLNLTESYHVDQNGCWIWHRALDGHGYGLLVVGYKRHAAHRFMYEKYKGKIPNGMSLDHLCRVPACINPDHLEPVLHRDNLRRGNSTKLTKDQVIEIRERYKNALKDQPPNWEGKPRQRLKNARQFHISLGQEYGTGPDQIRHIINGEYWKDLL